METKLRDEHGNPKYTNRLIHASSPYLVQHAHNPVDWYEWGDEALAVARQENKPVLVSIGYAACHWCHVLAHESFDDEETAALQNQLFVNIKVDREERPDIDSLYMSALQAMTRQGGWPLNVFCLPDGTPFYGGTYFPPDEKARRYGMPSWKQVLRSVAEAYNTRRADIEQTGRELVEHLASVATAGAVAEGESTDLPVILLAAVEQLAQSFDGREGGFGGAPKFPQPMTLEFLLRAHLRGDARALPMLDLTLRKMARGGMYDQLGGGFHRYSVDAHWLVPHFEKMLYDNALLARLYMEAFQATGQLAYRRIAEETLGYLLRDMRHPEGGIFSTEDADSLPHPGAPHAEEGLFYVWTPDELRELLGQDAALFAQIYDVSVKGNFEGRNILNLPRELDTIARVTGVSVERLEQVANRGRERLFKARLARPRPFRDEKIITAWNGMALRAFATATMALAGEPAAESYRQAAQAIATFALSRLRRPDGRLLRSWKDGRPGPLGFLDDYALLIGGLISLHAADGDPRWLGESIALADAMLDLFWDETLGGFYDTARDQENLITRPRDVSDNAAPSGNSAAVESLLRLAALTGSEIYAERARQVLAAMSAMLARFPAGFGQLLCAADFATAQVREVAIVGDPANPATQALLAEAQRPYRPNLVLARLTPGDTAAAALTPLLQNRDPLDGHPTAYVCAGFVCKLPVTTPEALREQLTNG